MQIFLIILAALVILGLALNYWGLRIREKGMQPINKAELDAEDQRIALTDTGRQIAYCSYGVQSSDAPVFINVHGSQLEAGFERGTYAQVCDTLQCRGIAISLPGYGFTDQKPGRQVNDWPAEDLAAVLKAEGIETFYITGHSQGTPHAMAAALHYADRCLGLGLNAPLLPTKLCQELGLGKTLGTGWTPTSARLRTAYMGWYFTLFHIVYGLLPPSITSSYIKKGFPRVAADTALMHRFETALQRSTCRGTTGSAWESAQDTCFDWGFDVRDLHHSNACVWHADDDQAIPPDQGKWLAQHLDADYRHEAEGYGHLTYCAGQYQDPEKSLISALLTRAR